MGKNDCDTSDINVTQESGVPGGFGSPNYSVATDDDGNRAVGSNDQEAIDNLCESRDKD